MSDLPVQFSLESHDWATFTLAALDARLENSQSENLKIEAHWDDPEDPQWSILLANRIYDQLKNKELQWNENAKQKALFEQFLQNVLRWLKQAGQVEIASEEGALQRLVLVQQVAMLYSALHGKGLQRVEGSLLQILFASGHVTAIQLGVDYLLMQSPSNWADVSIALSPLVQSKTWPIQVVFPKLLQSDNPCVLAPALDVANHVFRSRRPELHPAFSEFPRLLALLGGLSNQLGMLEENPRRFGDSVSKIQRILFDSVSLAVSLCDTLGLMGNPEAIGKLNQALQLSHRRIQTEAAFALAKLGDKQGKLKVLELASDFSCRQRAVAYAEELGIENELDERWTTATALAESRLANWLAQNEQMGIAPSRLELIEQRTLYWPGFDQPQECFLFRFEYDMQESVYSNLGFSGPMCHSFADDLANISIDDAFAIFAGYDIDHPDVYELPQPAWMPSIRSRVQPWLQEMHQRFDAVEVLFLGVFLEHQALLCRGQKGTERRVYVFDGDKYLFEPFPKSGDADPKLTYLLWRGRLFLATSEYSADSAD